jgi:hypothetical protein
VASTRAYVNGRYQRRGLEYIEGPSSGRLQFAEEISPSATVYVCYVQAGPL